MSKFQKGDFIKQVGGDAGILFDGKNWIKFECLGCAYAKGLLSHRLQNGDYTRIWTAYFGNTMINCKVKHDNQLHKSWLEAGKPVKGL